MKIKLHFEEDELRFIPTQEEIKKMILFASEGGVKGIEKIVIEPTTDIINSVEIGDNVEKVLLGYRVKAYSQFVWDRYISRSSLG
jgi:hypothetical protein